MVDDNSFPVAADKFLADAVKEILTHEDQGRFFAWALNYLADAFRRTNPAPFDFKEIQPLATNLAITIWNATPLPAIGRNSPCPCNSGKKFKKCCFVHNTPPLISTEEIWLELIEHLPAAQLQQALREHQIPMAAVGGSLADGLYADKPKKRAQLLEPFFEGDKIETGPDGAAALDLLLEAYESLGYWKKKETFISRLLHELPASPLRSAVFQRQATIVMDQGDTDGAWDLYKKAMKDTPNDPVLGILEIQLLLVEDRTEQAAQSARMWLSRARKQGFTDDDPVVQIFEAARHDPSAFIAQYEPGLGDDGTLLLDWFDEIETRAIPAYDLQPFIGEDPKNDSPDDEEFFKHHFEGNEASLKTPKKIASLERRWAMLFPLEKPFSIYLSDPSAADCWLPIEDEWLDFLYRHPEGADSLSIIDDLATALEQHPAAGGTGWTNKLFLPLLERARKIIDKTLATSREPVILPWLLRENRPALRSLFRLALCHDERGKKQDFLATAEQLIRLNPMDNHGIRAMLINAYLRAGMNAEAMTLAQLFPKDIFPETMFGKTLALFRTGHKGDAATALAGALKRHGKIPRYLTATRIKQPEFSPMGLSIGGDDQAWHYRQEMRRTWEETPDALEWLKRQCKI
ncbi:MAG: SEC-C metal-binding domain-containing protein [Desulfobulbaceae bacterium]|nr:SEC-C metal-binding domain-containing protein [Desulfobulbaceae bacterium]